MRLGLRRASATMCYLYATKMRDQLLRYLRTGLTLAVFIFLILLFQEIFLYCVFAVIIALILRPVVRFLNRLKVRGRPLPHALAAVLSLSGFYILIVILLWLVLPLFASQISDFSNIDTQQVVNKFHEPLKSYEYELAQRGIVFDSEAAVKDWLKTQYDKWMNFEHISALVDGLISITGSFLIGFFSVSFIAFFLLKDRKLFPMVLLFISPARYNRGLIRVYYHVKRLLRRYFTGLLLQMLILATVVFTGLSLFGFDNALLIASVAAFINIIPYLGPMLGFILATVLTLSQAFAQGNPEIGIIVLKLMLIFAIMQLVDNLLLQPMIYSSSVKAHPLEIFLVILMAGKLAGVGGMIVAVPAYTVIRVVLAEFMSSNTVVQSMTAKLKTRDQKP